MVAAMRRFKRLWQGLRTLSGEDAYERYLAHWRDHHGAADGPPLDRKTFYKRRLDRKWSGINRCC